MLRASYKLVWPASCLLCSVGLATEILYTSLVFRVSFLCGRCFIFIRKVVLCENGGVEKARVN